MHIYLDSAHLNFTIYDSDLYSYFPSLPIHSLECLHEKDIEKPCYRLKACTHRSNHEELTPHEVEHPHGAGALGVGQQRAIVAPGHTPPLGLRVFRNWNREERVLLPIYYKER